MRPGLDALGESGYGRSMGHEQHGDRPANGAPPDGAVDTSDDEVVDSADERRRSSRRQHGRYDVTWPVDCEGEDTFLYAAIANISAMGIFVRTVEPLAIGSELTLRFEPTAPGDAGSLVEPFVLRGAVQWVNRDVSGSPNPGMGLRFVELSADDRERIVDVIRTIAYLREDPTARDPTA